MLDFLFTVIIYPIRLLIECIYMVLSASIFKDNIGIALAGLSLAVNLLCLPLYAKAEQLQEIERNIQKKMANRIASIRKNFKGDEQYMILSMYYRENHYHPAMALRSSLSLLMQIPFFIAAYSFLSHLDSLRGRPLFFITDLSAPDGLFSIGGFQVNILPVIMTIINTAAGIVYSRGFPLKEKVQLYGMSLFFLALLYNSPAALVLYWTMNNIFSLVKNILFKVKNPWKIVYLAGCAVFAAFMIYVLFFRYNEPRRAFRNKAAAVALFVLFTSTPLYVRLFRYLLNKKLKFLFDFLENERYIFPLSCLCIWLLTGCYIPINLAASDPVQFASVDPASNPFAILWGPAVQGAGLFLFWPLYIYFLFSKKAQGILTFLMAALAFSSFVNFFVFHGNYGTISQALSFKIPANVFLAGSLPGQMLNISACIVLVILLGIIVSFGKSSWIRTLESLCVIGMLSFCGLRLVQIRTEMIHHTELQERAAPKNSAAARENISPVFTLSRTGKNVFVIMLDNAVGAYFPLFLERNPGYQDSFNGFVYYSNTASFFRNTLFGTPALFGGYEYSTYHMNERTDKTMKEKHNEAMLLLPELFRQRNFDVTVTDMPYINYEGIMDPGFYRERGIGAENILGAYNKKYINEVLHLEEYSSSLQISQLLRRNILVFAVFETSILSLRDFIYQNGKYWSSVDYSLDSGVSDGALGSYTTLYYLPELTSVQEGGDTFSIMVNELTHDPVYLQYPGFTVEEKITETGGDFFNHPRSYKDYHVNAASYILLSKWFEHLKENGLWDNTRIIIVSDHGDYGITLPGFSSFQNLHTLQYNPILLFKDFNREGEIKTSGSFMTNADTVFLSLEGIVENAVNPFTGRVLKPEKAEGIYIYTEGYTNPEYYSGVSCLKENSKFFHVHDSIFESTDWRELRYRDLRTGQ